MTAIWAVALVAAAAWLIRSLLVTRQRVASDDRPSVVKAKKRVLVAGSALGLITGAGLIFGTVIAVAG